MPDAPAPPEPAPERDAVASANPGAAGWLVGGALVFMLALAAVAIVLVSRWSAEPSAGYAAAPVAEDAEVPAGWVTYRDSASRVAFAVPPHWRFATELDAGAAEPTPVAPHTERVRSWLDGDPAEPPFSYIEVNVGTDVVVAAPGVQAEAFAAVVADSLPGAAVSEPRAFTTATGLDGAWIELSASEQEPTLDGAVVALVNGTHVWILATWSVGGEVDDALFERLVDTVRIDRGDRAP